MELSALRRYPCYGIVPPEGGTCLMKVSVLWKVAPYRDIFSSRGVRRTYNMCIIKRFMPV